MSSIPADYEERVYAGWLGKCIGVRLGAPTENWTYQEIRDNLGEITDYFPLPAGTVFKPDDDTSMPMILLRAIQDYGPAVTASQIGDTWLNYLGDQRGTLWWGGYGVSSEHTAYLNLKNGIPAPKSGSAALNGKLLSEQIGGQIFSDIWGLVAPNNPGLAATYAARASSVSHDGNGILGGMFVAALVSAAFNEPDPRSLIRSSLTVIPPESEYARMVNAVLKFHRKNPGDWRQAYHFIHQNYGYDRYPGTAHIIPNAALIVLGLLYGEGDFSHSIQITNMAGWDTDCNVGNVGAIMGVAVGLNGINDRWRKPINDTLVTAGIIGVRNLTDLPSCAELIANLGRTIAGEKPHPRRPHYNFDLPGSTHGFQHSGKLGSVLNLQQVSDVENGGRLKIILRKLKKKGAIRLFTETYLHLERLSANYYGASFSPKIYPGQTMRARIYLPANSSNVLSVGLYVWDSNQQENHQAPASPLTPGQWKNLVYTIPHMQGVCLSQAGIVFRNLGEPWTGPVFLDYLDWDGTPDFQFDFTKEQPEYDAISQWTFLRGFWRLEDGAYHGSGPEISETYSGDMDWRDYTLQVSLTPILGNHHLIMIRVQGALRSYGVGLAPNNEMVLYKNERGYRPIARADFAWNSGESYQLELSCENNRLSARIAGGPELEWIDDLSPYLNGQIGLSNFGGCHTRFERVAVFPNRS
ncbi:MAG: ADP-ribosylglycohydrolase family protein [Anaerolineales bacterium]|nr:ADP-ribosylglycohydrolase family protein [Anaerolineales bacterium]